MGSATENRYVNVYVNNKGVKGTYNELRKEAFKLRAELNSGKLTQDEFNKKVKELKSTDAVLKKHRDSLRGVGTSWSKLKSIMLGVIGGNVILGAFQKLAQFIPNLISQNAKLADSFTDVRKTTGLTEEGVEDLNKRLGTIDTRTARSRLLELARDAGKLGITGVENISQFVKAADQIDVALGEDLGDGAITQLGKLNNLFGTSDVFGYQEGLLKLGSVINELGANSEATEANIVDFTSRLAGIADQADISFDQLAGYGATLDSIGQRTETSSTAISQAIVGMFKDTATYAKIAGVDLEDFTKLLNEDSNEAFIQFLNGLNGNNAGLTEMSKKFDDLGIDGSRAITVLGALSSNTGQLREQQTLANQAFREGTSLTAEFNQKNQNAAGNLEKIGRAINKLWVNSTLKSGIDSITTSLAAMVEVPISENLEQQRIRFNGLINVLRDANTAEETRLEIITQLNESYGDRIGNIDLETASMEDLEQIQMRVNQQYLIEIALQTQREKLTEIGEKIAETNERRTKASIAGGEALTKANEKLGTSYGTVAEAMADLEGKALERYDSGLKRVVQLNEEAQVLRALREASGGLSISEAKLKMAKDDQNEAMQEQIDLIGQLKKDYPELAGIIDNSFGGSPQNQGVEEEEKKITTTTTNYETEDDQKEEDALAEKYEQLLALIQTEEAKLAMAKLEGQELEKAKVDQHYDALKDKALGHTEELEKIETLREEAKGAVKAQYAEQRAAAEEQVGDFLDEIGGTAEDPEIAALEAKFEAMIAIADQYGLDTVTLEKTRVDAITALQEQQAKDMERIELDKWRKNVAILQGAADDVLNGLIALNQGAASENSKFAAFQKKIGAVQMGVAAGVALANAIKSASTVPYPANLVAIASAIGSTLAFLGTAKDAFAATPETPEYALGTMKASGNFIAGDQGREIVSPAQVIPAEITQDILASNSFSRSMPQPNFSAINDGLTYSQSQQQQSGSQGGGGGMDLTPLIDEIRELKALTRQAGLKPVVFRQGSYQKFRDDHDQAEAQVVFKQK